MYVHTTLPCYSIRVLRTSRRSMLLTGYHLVIARKLKLLFQIIYVIEFPTAHIIDPLLISSLCCVSLFLSATLYFADPSGRAV
jgi:hypothetical protein